jgi:WD40 repeat protein
VLYRKGEINVYNAVILARRNLIMPREMLPFESTRLSSFHLFHLVAVSSIKSAPYCTIAMAIQLGDTNAEAGPSNPRSPAYKLSHSIAGHSRAVTVLKFTPDGRTLVSAGEC